jgi:hypothetical protein
VNEVERRQWVLDLMVDDVTQGLCGAQQAELDLLLLEDGATADERDSMLRAATAAELAFALVSRDSVADSVSWTSLPQSLERSLEQLAATAVRGELPQAGSETASGSTRGSIASSVGDGGSVAVLSFPGSRKASTSSTSSASNTGTSNTARDVSDSSGDGSKSSVAWWLAAAAALLAVVGWLPRMTDASLSQPAAESVVAEETAATPVAPVGQLAPSTLPADYKTVLAMAGTEDAAGAGASGQLLWDSDRQQGVMLIRGLAENDRQVTQYQLWIFDALRDERHPIDGGVFDISSSATRLADGSVVVPIDPRLPVSEATLFAITVEKPGGVVVSDRERIVMVAAPA